MQPNVWLTLRGAIRSGHDDDTVLEQILKKLLENHGIGNIGDLQRATHKSHLRNASQRPTGKYTGAVRLLHMSPLLERSHHSYCGLKKTSKDNYLKLIKAEKTSFLTDLLGNGSNGVVGFGHFPCFPLRHTLLQPMDSWAREQIICSLIHAKLFNTFSEIISIYFRILCNLIKKNAQHLGGLLNTSKCFVSGMWGYRSGKMSAGL